MAYDAANRSAADGSDGAAARQHRARDATDTGANYGVLILRRHTGATTLAKHRCHYKHVHC